MIRFEVTCASGSDAITPAPEVTAAHMKTQSMPLTILSQSAFWVKSAFTYSTLLSWTRGGDAWVVALTLTPSAASLRTRLLPMNPAPPATTILAPLSKGDRRTSTLQFIFSQAKHGP